MNYKEILLFELNKYNLNWCTSCSCKSSHKRGFVLFKDKSTIHFDSSIQTRNSLFNAFHEIGHCLNNENGLRSFEREKNAEQYAKNKFREYSISIPRSRLNKGKNYILRKKVLGNKHIRNLK